MAPGASSTKLTAVVVFLLCLTVWSQAAALAAEGEQHHPSDHCCLLCHVGPLAILQTPAAAVPAPLFAVVWLVPLSHFVGNYSAPVAHRSSRAPPG